MDDDEVGAGLLVVFRYDASTPDPMVGVLTGFNQRVTNLGSDGVEFSYLEWEVETPDGMCRTRRASRLDLWVPPPVEDVAALGKWLDE